MKLFFPQTEFSFFRVTRVGKSWAAEHVAPDQHLPGRPTWSRLLAPCFPTLHFCSLLRLGRRLVRTDVCADARRKRSPTTLSAFDRQARRQQTLEGAAFAAQCKSTPSAAKLQRPRAQGAQLCSNRCGSLASVAPSAVAESAPRAHVVKKSIQCCFHPATYTRLMPLPRSYLRIERVTRVPTHTAAWLQADLPC